MLRKTLCVFCAIAMLFSFSLSASASAGDATIAAKQVNISQGRAADGRAVDTSFTLDFDESEIWVLDFTNYGSAFNHKELKVKMGSVSPNNPNTQVKIELRVFDSAQGDYVPLASQYSVNFIPGQIEIFDFPYGAIAKKYRLIFARLTNTLSKADFTVISDDTFHEWLRQLRGISAYSGFGFLGADRSGLICKYYGAAYPTAIGALSIAGE